MSLWSWGRSVAKPYDDAWTLRYYTIPDATFADDPKFIAPAGIYLHLTAVHHTNSAGGPPVGRLPYLYITRGGTRIRQIVGTNGTGNVGVDFSWEIGATDKSNATSPPGQTNRLPDWMILEPFDELHISQLGGVSSSTSSDTVITARVWDTGQL